MLKMLSPSGYTLAGLGTAFTLALVLAPVFRSRPGQAVQTPPDAWEPARAVKKKKALKPVRPIPARFPRDTHMPTEREGTVSGSIDLGTFSPGRSLTYVDDPDVRWESDNDKGDTEDDHTIHRSLELPLRRLIALVKERGATLKVQDTYRPALVHNPRSLHKEGRAVDVTAEGMALEELAKLCWAAGFDWVFHEASAKGGAHIHCSVRR